MSVYLKNSPEYRYTGIKLYGAYWYTVEKELGIPVYRSKTVQNNGIPFKNRPKYRYTVQKQLGILVYRSKTVQNNGIPFKHSPI